MRTAEVIAAERPIALGDPELALDDAQMLAKARMLLEHAGCDEASVQRLTDGILQLAESPDCSDIVEFVLFLSKSEA